MLFFESTGILNGSPGEMVIDGHGFLAMIFNEASHGAQGQRHDIGLYITAGERIMGNEKDNVQKMW